MIPLPHDPEPLPPGRLHRLLKCDDGLPRIGGVLVANIGGLAESGWGEVEIQAYYAAGGRALSLDDIAAAVAFVRQA